jgi:hypothetical protein
LERVLGFRVFDYQVFIYQKQEVGGSGHFLVCAQGNYCIVSGVWNPLLDAGGDEQKSFFRNLEKFVLERTGVEPRCWHEPDYVWQEE